MESEAMKESARYLKIVEWSEEDQCFVGSCPGLFYGGCHGGDEQQVFAELCQMVEEMIAIWKNQAPPAPPRPLCWANDRVDVVLTERYSYRMHAVEFTTELSGTAVLQIPSEAAAQLPKTGRVRVIVLTDEDTEDAEWRSAAYEQFVRDDSREDAIYDSMA